MLLGSRPFRLHVLLMRVWETHGVAAPPYAATVCAHVWHDWSAYLNLGKQESIGHSVVRIPLSCVCSTSGDRSCAQLRSPQSWGASVQRIGFFLLIVSLFLIWAGMRVKSSNPGLWLLMFSIVRTECPSVGYLCGSVRASPAPPERPSKFFFNRQRLKNR